MFKKLVSNLPFNPSLVNQVGFYADRLRQEKSVRRLSFVFMALAMAVQSLAVISPPEQSLGLSNNRIINGVQTKQDILNAYDGRPANAQDVNVKEIFTRFNLTREDIVNLPDRPNTRVFSGDGNQWRTIGRTSLSNYTRVADIYKQTENEVQYVGADGQNASVYARDLRAWDIVNRAGNYYDAWKGVSSATGQEFWILKECGNITWVGPWETPEPDPDPDLQIRKTQSTTTDTLKPGDSFTYRIEYRNPVVGTTAEDVFIEDQIDLQNLTIVSPRDLNVTSSGFLRHEIGNLRGSNTYDFLEITVQLKNPLPSPTQVCNVARIVSSNAGTDTSDNICVDVITPCPYDPSIPDVNNPNCTIPKVVCSVVDAVLDRTNRKATYKTTVSTTNDALVTINSYNYDFGDGQTETIASNEFMNTTMHSYEPGEYKTTVTVNYTAPTDDGQTEQQVSCMHSISFDADEPLGQQKTVENITRNLKGQEAIDSKVRAGEVLEYTLTTLNSQDYERVGITVEDYIGDILDYADLDTDALAAEGGRYDADTKKVIWEDISIPANAKVEHKFRVTMKNPLPATNQPSVQGSDFDCTISNTYGNTVNMSVACPVVKSIETIPNTGPGTSMIIITSITGVVGYFFARSRLLSKEIDLVRSDYAVTGGM